MIERGAVVLRNRFKNFERTNNAWRAMGGGFDALGWRPRFKNALQRQWLAV
jgi:hypothetical protein